MLQAVTTSPGEIRVQSAASLGIPGAGEALIRVERVGICGSDGHIYDGTHPYLGFPQIQGHEIVGRIVAAAGDGTGPREGTRVVVEPAHGCGSCIACRRGRENCCTTLQVIGVTRPGGLQEELLVPTAQLHDVGTLEADAALFAEPFSIGIHAIDRARPRSDDAVLVLGAGSIGMTVALTAAARGLPTVVAERRAERRQVFASVDGISAVPFDTAAIERAFRALSVDGPSVVIDTTGAPSVLAMAVDLVTPAGTLVSVGISAGDFIAPIAALTRKELTIVGARNSNRDFPAAIQLAQRWGPITTAAIKHRYSLDRAREAVALVANQCATGKVVVECS